MRFYYDKHRRLDDGHYNILYIVLRKLFFVDFSVLLVSFLVVDTIYYCDLHPTREPEFVHPAPRVTPICLEPTSNWFCTFCTRQEERRRRGTSGTRRCAEYNIII